MTRKKPPARRKISCSNKQVKKIKPLSIKEGDLIYRHRINYTVTYFVTRTYKVGKERRFTAFWIAVGPHVIVKNSVDNFIEKYFLVDSGTRSILYTLEGKKFRID